MQGKLTVKKVNGKEMILTFKENEKIIIGRNKRCNLIVSDSKISSMHCQIDTTTNECRFVDLGSTNGTFVNDNKVSTSQLQNNDIIKLGNVSILVEYKTTKIAKKNTQIAEITETWSEDDLPAEEIEYINDYRILKKIGDFGSGENFQAEHRTHKNIVALRKLPVSSQPEAFKKFAESIDFYKTLDSVRIIKTLDIVEDKGVPILVTEYIQGCTLEHWLQKRQKISVSRSLKIAAYVASGLEYLHRSNIAGIDLCPHHIILEELTKRIKIFDIATARFLRENGYDNLLFYENIQAFSSKKHKGEFSDIYSLGSLLFFLLMGKSPEDEENSLEKLRNKRSIPPEIIALVESHLKNPEQQRIKSYYQIVTQVFQNLKKKKS